MIAFTSCLSGARAAQTLPLDADSKGISPCFFSPDPLNYPNGAFLS